MIVIHIDTMADTHRLSRAYEGLDGVTLLYNPTREEVVEELERNDDNLVMCLGHGTSRGLFSADFRGYVIDGYMADLLENRTMIGIWCYASDFASTYGMHGYFTSMFISNVGEARMNGFYEATEEEINDEIDEFCDSIRGFIEEHTEMDCWVDILQENCHRDRGFVRFNYEAMSYYE